MSQYDRILAILNDRRAHTAAELYATGCVLHSRISVLRKRGYTIDVSRADGVGATSYLYTLTSVPGEAASAAAASPGTEANAADSGCHPSELAVPDYIEGQIDIWSALADAGAAA